MVVGLGATVRILRDEWGIPHVAAASQRDAFSGQGYATAEDRLWHMDYDRMRGLGRWAEWAGEAGVDSDTLLRRFELERHAVRDLAALSPPAREMLQAYADGVNGFLAELAVGRATLPPEYALLGWTPEAWRPTDCLVVFQVRHVSQGGHEAKLWRAKLLAALGPEEPWAAKSFSCSVVGRSFSLGILHVK
jgi:penicillin amidase